AVEERHEFLDVLRGFALLGIVLANMHSLSLYVYQPPAVRAAMTGRVDRALEFLELVLVEGKFYTIFSVLFGIGFSILMGRAEAKGLAFRRFFLRRALLLFLIGALHAVLFWHNDILESYAFCGALLLAFAPASNRTVLLTAGLALFAPAALKWAGLLQRGALSPPRAAILGRFGYTADDRMRLWTEGSYVDGVIANAASWFGQVDYVVASGMLFRILGLFLVGLYLGRKAFHRDLAAHAALLARVAVAGIAVGLPLNVAYARQFEGEGWAHELLVTVAVPPLSAGYVALLGLAWVRTGGGTLREVFAPVGRMALTNYVGQSAIALLVFRSAGLGLGGRAGVTEYLLIGLAIYVVQLAASRAWMAHFRFGPLEWLWRMLTYGSWLSLSRRR
ncbi:MAG TPA: DUF418 domain-containing protein, partial [Vicinamibacteria bacterium]|nr:DUF418 domain-containing protein [Vicinamibacteria bacterium]